MEWIKHHRQYEVEGQLFEVLSLQTITDQQAELAVRLYCRSHPPKKRRKGQQPRKVIQVLWNGD